MRTRAFPILSLIMLVSLSIVPSLSAQDTKFMAVDEVRQGMKGFGKTVFQGTTVEQFGVEVLGVLRNFAPKQDMILVRLSGGPLERTGVIAGMSGSPVYIEGKLLGAVAFAFPFAKEPVAGVQPIQQMLDVLDQRPANTPKAANASSRTFPGESPTAFVLGQLQKLADGVPIHQLLLPPSLLGAGPFQSAAGTPSLMRIQTPLFVSGASPAALQQFAPFFNAFGFTPVQGGGGGSAANLAPASPSKLEPGSSVNVELIRGDISWSANGTVT